MKQKFFYFLVLTFISFGAFAQDVSRADEALFSGLKMRAVGPAFTSGRIADIAIHPQNDNVWYVAVGSGGVWKTRNAGTTWQAIFDNQDVYSIGCITIDPSNPSTLWVGTGENVGGRHVGFGDGVYKSTDGGKSWKNMGLTRSEHISKILVHPTNSNIVWVAAQGPLWSKGGDRGVYKTTDGGKSWSKVLGVDEWTGATDLVMDPTNPDNLYAATWQRHRTVAAYMGGGPGSGIYRSVDGGKTWEKSSAGLPHSNLGKIGLTVSPQHPEMLYAAVETDRRQGAVYKSFDKGASWQKQSNTVSGATGPHYYQELYASPHAYDRLYLMDVRIQVSDDGGKTFRILNERDKHSDNHAIAFRANDPNFLLVGSDGGLYESFDLAETWRFIPNLPIAQYYKTAVNDREPFYQIFGGTQDNGSNGGPSRTDKRGGIRNGDWFKILGADGYSVATEPGNPDIVYGEYQEGVLFRVDLKTGEQKLIQPQPRAGEDYERFNWDAPIVVSSHNPKRLYFASMRVWRSDDRGDNWTPISGDLTRNEERLDLPIMGRKQSWDNAWDVYAMSDYNSITSLSESPVQEGLLYAGTDDGLIQLTEDGGKSWSKIEVSSLPNVPERAFINDIKADLFDANTVYVVMDNHKSGDFKPYIYKSTNKGKSWKSINGNLPAKTLVWRVVQDHKQKELLFAGTEFGIYFTLNGGEKWVKMAGTPPIPFRDLAIQKRESDLVGASFGRGIFVMDDYSPLRQVNAEMLQKEAFVFPVKDAWMYIPRSVNGNVGTGDDYVADNPPFGAVFTYYLSNIEETQKQIRTKHEKMLDKTAKDIDFPGWEALEKEKREKPETLWFTIKDEAGNVIRNLEVPAKKGINRVAWDLRYASSRPIRSASSQARFWDRGGALVVPGTYTVSMSKEMNGQTTPLANEVNFEVVPLHQATLEGASKEAYLSFVNELKAAQTNYGQLSYLLEETLNKVRAMQKASARAAMVPGELNKQLYTMEQSLLDMQTSLYGMSTKNEIGERNYPSIGSYLQFANSGVATSYGPTNANKESLKVAQEMIDNLKSKLENLINEALKPAEKQLQEADAPVIL